MESQSKRHGTGGAEPSVQIRIPTRQKQQLDELATANRRRQIDEVAIAISDRYEQQIRRRGKSGSARQSTGAKSTKEPIETV